MSGHSKWSTIKRKKGAADAKRSKIFSKIVKEIQVSVKEGGADIDGNPRLRLAVNNAKGQNMPKENIERAISKAEKDGENIQEVVYEGYGPGGVGIYLECMTDNTNRTVSYIRSVLTKRGGNLGTSGSLSYIFDRKGVFTIPKQEDLDPEELELELIDAGAEDLDVEDEIIVVTCAMEDFGNMQKKLDELNITAEEAKLERIPNNTKVLEVESAKKFLNMVEEFEDDDDIQNLYHNLEMTDELASSIADD